MTTTTDYTEKILLITPPNGIRSNRSTTTTSTSPESGSAS
jgi:hypothetical protein